MTRILTALGAVAALVSASAASAHDFFLMPEQFVAPVKRPLAILATVGSSFPTPEIVVPADRADKLLAFGPGDPHVHIAGAGEKALNLQVNGAKSGLLVVGAGGKPRDVDYAEDRIPLILGEYRVAPEAAARGVYEAGNAIFAAENGARFVRRMRAPVTFSIRASSRCSRGLMNVTKRFQNCVKNSSMSGPSGSMSEHSAQCGPLARTPPA